MMEKPEIEQMRTHTYASEEFFTSFYLNLTGPICTQNHFVIGYHWGVATDPVRFHSTMCILNTRQFTLAT